MRGFASSVLSCRERERLEEGLLEARTRGRNLSRLRHLTYRERAALDEREQAAQARLRIMRWRAVAGVRLARRWFWHVLMTKRLTIPRFARNDTPGSEVT